MHNDGNAAPSFLGPPPPRIISLERGGRSVLTSCSWAAQGSLVVAILRSASNSHILFQGPHEHPTRPFPVAPRTLLEDSARSKTGPAFVR